MNINISIKAKHRLHKCKKKIHLKKKKHPFFCFFAIVIVSWTQWWNCREITLCVKEGSMKWKARARFIGIMGLLLLFHFNFTCGCNLCHTIIQFNLKDNKPIPDFVIANGLGCESTSHGPLSEVPACLQSFHKHRSKLGLSASLSLLVITRAKAHFWYQIMRRQM